LTPFKPVDILRHELIGLNVKVMLDSNPYNTSLSGRVVDESRNTLTIRHDDRDRIIPKGNALFRFTLPTGGVDVEGSYIVGRPEDRVKRKMKRRW